MSIVIRVNNLVKQFGDLRAVDNLSFTVNKGDVYGFLGQNGAGKSTTIRMLLTLVAPTSGEIEISGMKLKTHREAILLKVGAVIERPDLYNYMTAYENMRLFAKMSGAKTAKSHLLDQLEHVGLGDRAQSKVGTYSQGMKQRLGIAVALVNDPQIVVLDEPTNGLDPQGIADMRNMILHLSCNLNKTVVVSSHLLSEIELIANRMLIIDKGKKIVEGTVDELFDPAETVVELEVEDPASAQEVIGQSQWNSFVNKIEAGTFFLKMNKKNIPELVQFLSSHGIGVLSVRSRHSLEDYFLSLTSGRQHVDTFKY